ncbi:MAG: DUF1636 domain-containing protein [Rhodospirillaceae bacterium]|nr:DUF1636 domain-containing protein [Rhodospirillaceae bacterium]
MARGNGDSKPSKKPAAAKRKPEATAKAKAKAKKPSAANQPATLYICRSCVWSEAEREKDGKRQGEFLLEAIKQEILTTPLPNNTGMRAVHCLNGCKSPCNVAFRAAGKHGLRFSRLTPDNAEEVLAFLSAYNESEMGDVAEAEVPEGMRCKQTVRTPPPPIRSK